MSYKKLAFLSLLLCIFSFSAFSQKPRFKEKKIARSVKKHVSYLASDELEGRASGTPGEKLSADYIAKQFEKIGLEPQGDNGYFQYIDIPSMRIAQDQSTLKIDETVYTLFRDFYPLSASTNNGRYEGDIIHVGYGISDGGLKRDDYKDKDVRGKAVLMNIDLPGGAHPHNKFINWGGVDTRVEYAKSKGAKAVVFFSNSSENKPSGDLKKTLKNSGIPVLYVTADFEEVKDHKLSLVADILLLSTASHNVMGFIDNGANYTVVIGAHHDHLGHGQIGGSLSDKTNVIHNGADDNASGVAGLIELAKIVKKKPKKFANNNYLFVAFTGEELGLIGSKRFVERLEFKVDFMNYMINMDMIGMLDSTNKTLVINGVGTSPAWNTTLDKMSYPTKKIEKIKTTESGIGASDHSSFYLNGVPAVHFFTGQHEFYHKPEDDIERVNYGGTAFVISYICQFMERMDKQGRVEFTKTKQEEKGRRSFSVTLGVMPDYIYDGEGMRIDGVRDGKPGSVAGLESGDIVVNLNGTSILNIQDYMKVLSSLKKGDKVPISIKRNDTIILKEVQF